MKLYSIHREGIWYDGGDVLIGICDSVSKGKQMVAEEFLRSRHGWLKFKEGEEFNPDLLKYEITKTQSSMMGREDSFVVVVNYKSEKLYTSEVYCIKEIELNQIIVTDEIF